MDTALQLKIDLDNGVAISRREALERLDHSELVKYLTSDLVDKPLFYIWRIIALSEIPFAQHLEYTSKLLDRIFEKLSTPFGFSMSGDEKNFLPCYNAMLVSAMCRLGQAQNEVVSDAVEWIDRHQAMERGMEVSIPGFRFDRFGGCFKSIPCYIGLAKSVFALFDYQYAVGNKKVSPKLEQGIEYMLNHHLIERLHKNAPITQHILDISFPESYHLNIVELIRFVGKARLLDDVRTKYAVDYLQKNRKKDGGWKVSYRYKSNGFCVFDKGRKSGEWVSYIIDRALSNEIANNYLRRIPYDQDTL